MTRFKSSAFAQYLATAVAMIGLSQVAQAEDGSKWGGFFDAGFTLSGPQGVDPTVLRDAALYFNSTSGSTSFTFDMPFTAVTPGSNDLLIGFNKAQAYVKHSYSNGANWTLGQFDGIFGRERNDTVDLFFANQGALYASQPVTNTGIGVGYDLSKTMGVQVYASGSNGEGTSSLGDKPEFGAKLAMSGDYNIGVGGYYQKVTDTTKLLYTNLTVGTKMAGMDLGFEATYAKSGDSDAGMGFSLNGTTKVMGDIEGGIRAQYLSKIADFKEMELTAGLRQKMGQNLTVKANYTYDSTTATDGATAVTDHSGVIAAVYGF